MNDNVEQRFTFAKYAALAFIVVAATCFPVSIVFSILGGIDAGAYLWTSNWETTDAQILKSEVGVIDDFNTDAPYYPHIVFRYTVNDQLYESDSYALFRINTSERSSVEEQIAPYPVESVAQIYYNPNDPTEAIIDRTINDSSYVLLGLGVASCAVPIIFGTVLGIVLLRRRTRA